MFGRTLICIINGDPKLKLSLGGDKKSGLSFGKIKGGKRRVIVSLQSTAFRPMFHDYIKDQLTLGVVSGDTFNVAVLCANLLYGSLKLLQYKFDSGILPSSFNHLLHEKNIQLPVMDFPKIEWVITYINIFLKMILKTFLSSLKKFESLQ